MKLIDADALIERLDKRKTYEAMDGRNKAYVKGVRDAMKDVASAPTVIAAPVVRCGDCKHCYFASNRVPVEKAYVCSIFGYDVTLDFYCKNGEGGIAWDG